MINILDVGLGNVRSIQNWALTLTEHVVLVREPSDYLSGSLIIPGVASSSRLMTKVIERKLDILINNVVKTDPVLGICAGYQILCDLTTEQKTLQCLGLLNGRVDPLNEGKSFTGWKEVHICLDQDSPLSRAFPRNKYLKGRAFFNHSFGVYNNNTKHDFILSKNIVGCQFHPEKSRDFGQFFLRSLVVR